MIQNGLQLIAQFNFQRATGFSTRKSIPAQGTKNLRADFDFFGNSDFQIVTR